MCIYIYIHKLPVRHEAESRAVKSIVITQNKVETLSWPPELKRHLQETDRIEGARVLTAVKCKSGVLSRKATLQCQEHNLRLISEQ